MIFETTVNHKTKHCVTSRVLLASNEENVVLRPNKISLKSHFLRYQLQIWETNCLDICFDFLAGFEFNIYIV